MIVRWSFDFPPVNDCSSDALVVFFDETFDGFVPVFRKIVGRQPEVSDCDCDNVGEKPVGDE